MPVEQRMVKRRGPKQTPVSSHRMPNTDGTFVGQLENAVQLASENIVQTAKIVKQFVGDRPFGAERADIDHELQAYLSIRDNATLWGALIQTKGIVPVLKYSLRMEKALQRRDHRRHGSGTEADFTELGR